MTIAMPGFDGAAVRSGAVDRDRRPLGLHVGVERRRRAWRKANAAMRSLTPERADRIRPVDRKLPVEEDRMRHRRIVVFVGISDPKHPPLPAMPFRPNTPAPAPR